MESKSENVVAQIQKEDEGKPSPLPQQNDVEQGEKVLTHGNPESATPNGIDETDCATTNGIAIDNATTNGIAIDNATTNGIAIDNATTNGIHEEKTGTEKSVATNGTANLAKPTPPVARKVTPPPLPTTNGSPAHLKGVNGAKKEVDKTKASVLDVVKYPEFSESELNNLFKLFCKNANPPHKGGRIALPQMKQLLQALDLAQTHLEAKTTFEKFAHGGTGLTIGDFIRMVVDLTAKNGKISLDTVLKLASQGEVDVDNVGVGGAKRFFEAKAKILEVGDAAYRAFEDKKRQEEEQKKRQEQFKERMAKFQEEKTQ